MAVGDFFTQVPACVHTHVSWLICVPGHGLLVSPPAAAQPPKATTPFPVPGMKADAGPQRGNGGLEGALFTHPLAASASDAFMSGNIKAKRGKSRLSLPTRTQFPLMALRMSKRVWNCSEAGDSRHHHIGRGLAVRGFKRLAWLVAELSMDEKARVDQSDEARRSTTADLAPVGVPKLRP